MAKLGKPARFSRKGFVSCFEATYSISFCAGQHPCQADGATPLRNSRLLALPWCEVSVNRKFSMYINMARIVLSKPLI